MDCFLLGSGGMMPMPRRRLTSVAMRHEGRIYLFDCGEGTQVPYKELHLGLRSLEVVAVSHLHADHVLGLPGMLMLRAQMPDPPPLTILGPPQLRRFVDNVRNDLAMFINYPIEFVGWENDDHVLAYENDEVRIYWRRLNHSVLCLGYRLEERDRAGRFDADSALRLGVPRGPLWGRLQAGESVELEDGVVSPDQVLGPTRRGRHVTFITDTAPTERMQPLLTGADLAFVEGMFGPDEEQDAREKKHMTVVQACDAASRAEAHRVVLVHVSPRYGAPMVRELGQVATEHHPCVEVGKDGQLYRVALPD